MSVEQLRERILSYLLTLVDSGDLGGGDDSRHREEVAKYALAFIRSYVRATPRNWRSAGGDSIQDTADSTANRAVSYLLQQAPGNVEGRSTIPRLRKGLQSALVRTTADGSEEERLLLAFHSLMRMSAHQAHLVELRREHSEVARLVRQLKTIVKRLDGLRVHRDPLGQFICSWRSDCRKPPMSRDELALCCQDTPFLVAWDGAERILSHSLTPDAQHGGYCYLMDLVHIIHENRQRIFCESFPPEVKGIDITSSGIPTAIFRSRWRKWMWERTWRIALRQERKKASRGLTRGGLKAGHAHDGHWMALCARVAVAVEMAARRFGLGWPDLGGYSQRELLQRAVSSTLSKDDLSDLCKKTDYVVRCLVTDLESLDPGVLRGGLPPPERGDATQNWQPALPWEEP